MLPLISFADDILFVVSMQNYNQNTVNNVISSLNKYNATKIELQYSGGMIFLAYDIKKQMDLSKITMPIVLTNLSLSNNVTSYHVNIVVYGTYQQHQPKSFYNYDTGGGWFYYQPDLIIK
ncbi:MAG: hypothetical protein K2P99_01135 [Burkholderiales bacterium]|nr:hypothetical protein [Burkholderiales bacterium]